MTERKRQKRATRGGDWDPADIVAALRKKGWSVRGLSVHHDYRSGVLSDAIRRRWPRGQELIAEAIGVPAEKIWPSRYIAKDTKRRRSVPARAAA